jgi:glucose-6-phosphate 1-dehydrogenase
LDDAGYRTMAAAALVESGIDAADAAAWVADNVSYHRVGRDEPLDGLAVRMETLDSAHGLEGNRVLYLALPPAAFEQTIDRLGSGGLAHGEGWTRIVVEKPFGSDLESARAINRSLHRHFAESQIFRIDHYLGKETVQNLLVFRFTNPIFEASWNRDRVERVEITVAESLDVTGRGAYYDRTGVLADMVQSHLTQVLTLVAMEAPSTFGADAVRDEKVKVLRSIREIPAAAVVAGQFGPGTVAGQSVTAYRETAGVAPESTTPTYAAVRVWIDNWRWQGVPFLLRTGKALPRRTTEVAVLFRRPPVCLFHAVVDDCIDSNDVLRLVLQPEEGFSLEVDVKEPGTSTRLHPIRLHFSYGEAFGEIPDAYETLLADVIEGDQTLFVRSDEVEEAWRLYTPLLRAALPLAPYAAGSWGPPAADGLLPEGARGWATT